MVRWSVNSETATMMASRREAGVPESDADTFDLPPASSKFTAHGLAVNVTFFRIEPGK